jgi:hypothetical protein
MTLASAFRRIGFQINSRMQCRIPFDDSKKGTDSTLDDGSNGRIDRDLRHTWTRCHGVQENLRFGLAFRCPENWATL